MGGLFRVVVDGVVSGSVEAVGERMRKLERRKREVIRIVRGFMNRIRNTVWIDLDGDLCIIFAVI